MKLREMLREQPVVVTGMGAVSAAGAGVNLLWQAATRGISPAQWLAPEQSGTERLPGCVAPTPEFEGEARHLAHKADRCVQLALAAAQQAWAEAKLPGTTDPQRIGVIAGTSRGPVNKWSESAARLGRGRMLPTLAANSSLACLSGTLSLALHAQGPCFTVSAACASAVSAIGLAAQQILCGAADVMLAGGAEAPLNPIVLAQLHAAGILGHDELPQRACRPFDANRNGTLAGEGAAFLVLESLVSARARGARPLARLAGWAMSSESSTRAGMSETGEGLFRVMRRALDVAELAPRHIGYINAHGTGTRLNDRAEASAIARLFAERPVPCSSTKPVTGHCMGASAALEAVITIMALQTQFLPPTANCETPEVPPQLDLILGKARRAEVSAVLSNSAGFWGHDGALVFTLPGGVLKM
ncbi:MAG: beta-ketoacyl-[acyl-carrier-protein] synthase family protein [Verrucomicrobia bacterium]|nr:beta-ketoacyl-[acyl-carrier-protein] synthase family protein [Verrucomicrobiota bacterium]